MVKAAGDPLISVVVPTYNEEHYIGDLLESIKNQTYRNYEIIAIDSYSKDKTRSILKKYGATVIEVPKSNIAAARNAGIKRAKGDIIAFIDADYVLSKHVFEGVVNMFSYDPLKKIAAIEPSPRVNNKDIKLRDRMKFRILNSFVLLHKKISFITMVPAAYGCVFCRASYVRKAGLFNEDLDVAEDKEYFLRIRKNGEFAMLEYPAKISYRRHAKEGMIKTNMLYLAATLSMLVFKKFKFKFRSIRRGKKGN